MKRNFLFLIMFLATVGLTGCETAKYAFDQTMSEQREFGPNSRETQKVDHSDIALASADDWVRRNMW